MDQDRFIRRIFWVSAVFNLGAAFVFAFPDSLLGQWAGLPTDVPLIYSALVALFVVLFGGMYVWLAVQPVIPTAFVSFAAIGKGSVFVMAAMFWMAGEIPSRTFQLSIGDLALAAIYVWWLNQRALNDS